MALRISDKFVSEFVSAKEIQKLIPEAKEALNLVKTRSGAGNDYLGWYDLPVNYDKEEFARIKIAADKIRKNSDVLVVIGIGGSYLGARAAIEFVKSPLYNNLKKDTPDIHYRTQRASLNL